MGQNENQSDNLFDRNSTEQYFSLRTIYCLILQSSGPPPTTENRNYFFIPKKKIRVRTEGPSAPRAGGAPARKNTGAHKKIKNRKNLKKKKKP